MDGRVGLVARCLAPLAAAALALGLAPRAVAQLRADPVETLRQALSVTSDDTLERDRRTKACLGELRSLSELRKAVVLREWRHRYPDARLAAVDQQNRDDLAERFRQATRQVLAGRDPAAALAALEMLGETAASMRAVGEPPVLTRPLTPDVARLVGEGEPAVRAAAAKALGLIEPDLAVALPLLTLQMKSPDAAVRLNATTALGQVLETTAQPWTGNQFNPTARLDRRETADAAAKLLAPLGQAAVDPGGEVRRSSLTALALAATLLGKLTPPAHADIPDSVEGARAVRRAEAEREEARPLALALREQLAAVNRCLRGRDSEVKVLALKVCEEAAQARLRWLQRPGTPEPADDPLAAPLAAALPGMAQTLTDDNVNVRRATLDALELYGPLASAAAPAVTRALKDADPFVRWSAVRTLGGIGPAARPAIPALTKLLQDPDLDVRLAAAAVLQTLDSTGKEAPGKPGQSGGSRPRSALPALIQALGKKDSDTRLAAIHALAAMGGNARPAVPALAEAVRDADSRVRLAAVQALGQLGPAAKSAADTLRQAMHDDNPDVLRAAGDALLNMEREP
jgi:HEAT repeat protein